jgi:hypothetical protein
MSTDPFSNIGFTTEIGQPTFIELIVAKREIGKAIRTICYTDEVSNEQICDPGPSPIRRLRELAFGKKPLTNNSSFEFSATKATIKNLPAQKYSLSNEKKYKKQSNEFHELLRNSLVSQLTPSTTTCTSNLLLNGTFDSNLSGWLISGNVYWDSSTTSAILKRELETDDVPTISQSQKVQEDKNFRLDFDLSPANNYDLWELTIEIKDSETIIYIATIDQDDGFGTFSVGEIPLASSGTITVEFQNTSDSTMESKILKLDNIKLCYDNNNNTLTCSSGFRTIEKTDFSSDGANNWEVDGLNVSDRLNLETIDKPVNLENSDLKYGVFFGNDQGDIGLAGEVASQNTLADKLYAFNIGDKVVKGIDASDIYGRVYVALQNNSEIEIKRFNYDGSNPTTIYSQITTAGINCIAIDDANDFIFFGIDNQVRRIDFDGNNHVVVYPVTSGEILDIKVDKANERVYFIRNNTATDSSILSTSYIGDDLAVVDSLINDPRCLALDVANDLIFVGTGEIDTKIKLYSINISDNGFEEILSTDPIIEPNIDASFKSFSGIDLHPNGLLYLAAGFGLWAVTPDGNNFHNIFNPEDLTGETDIKGSLHIVYQKSVVVKKLFRDLQSGSLVRFTVLLDDLISAGGDRSVSLRLARPEGGTAKVSIIDNDIGTVTYSADNSGILVASIELTSNNGNVDVGVFECLLCGGDTDSRPQCSSLAPNEIDYQNFNSNDGNWIASNGITPNGHSSWNESEGLHEIDNTFEYLTKKFTSITPGTFIELHFDIVAISTGSTLELTIVNQFEEIIVYHQYTSSAVGITISSVVNDDIIFVRFKHIGNGSTKLDNILLCSGTLGDCRIYETNVELSWSGSPIRPVNIFEGFVKYKIRSRIDSSKVAYVYQPFKQSLHLSSTNYCDFWKQQGNGKTIENNPLAPTIRIDTINNQDITSTNLRNWIWSLPVSNGDGNDKQTILFDDPQTPCLGRRASGDIICAADINDPNYDPNCIVESASIFMHMNQILTLTAKSNLCPMNGLVLKFNFKDGKGITKSYEKSIDLAALYSINEQQVHLKPWDGMSSVSDGIPGDYAKWEKFEFILDNLTGTGLNQCTIPEVLSFTGNGTLGFPAYSLKGRGYSAEGCNPEAIITTESDGIKTDEIQSIILPSPSAGTYNITLFDQGVSDTITIPWNADAAQLRVRLGQLGSVGGTRNVFVEGHGILESPFLVTFVDQLSGRDMNLMIADDSNLQGTGDAVIQTIRNGTQNEQQTIHNTNGTIQDFSITFNGQTTVEMPFNVSLADMQSALEGIDSINAGNVTVVGDTENRDTEYSGPWIVQFKGDLGDQNLPEMIINSIEEGYEVITDWNGGSGINEIQEMRINATSGTYTLTFTNPSNENDIQITGDIAYNAPAADILNVIIGSIGWLNAANFNVRFIEDGVFRFIFKENLWGLNIPQATINTDLLRGGSIQIEEIQKGGATREKQRIVLKNVTGGTWAITIILPNVGSVTTTKLDWNATAQEVEQALIALPGLVKGDVSVGGDFPVYLVVFKKTLGNIDPMEIDISELECNPFIVLPVPPPPYHYDFSGLDVSEIPPGPSPISPISDSANVFVRTNFQRYLFDPNFKNNPTVRELATSKGINVLDYVPYKRKCDNSSLIPITYDDVANTKESFVLIEKQIDSTQGRQRIIKSLSNSRKILPTRFTWECLNF